MDRGVVVIDGTDKPADGTVVVVTPAADASHLAAHPALGIWKDRTDLPADPVEASKVLRERMTRRDEAAAGERPARSSIAPS